MVVIRAPLRRFISIFFTCSGVRSSGVELEEGGGVVGLPVMARVLTPVALSGGMIYENSPARYVGR
jgi:hypothetical protein